MIKNIIFDLGGVILKHKSTLMEDILSKMFPDQKQQAWELYKIHIDKLRTGNINSKKLIRILKKELKSRISLNKLMNIWILEFEKHAEIDYKILELILNLKKSYNVFMLTDTIDVHDDYNSKRGIYSHFKLVVKSFEEGLRKPSKEAFQNLLKKVKSNPQKCLFIDDLKENVKAAEKVGMKGIVYKNISQLKADLRKLGVKI